VLGVKEGFMITGEIIGVEQTQDAQKNIIIWICFSQDGAEIELSNRVVDGHKVWPLYARFENFLGKSAEMIQEWIRLNVEYQIGNIIKERLCKESLNTEFMVAISKLKGVKFSAEKVSIDVDTTCTGTIDSVIELKADATYQVK
jgi:hypothetical protein